MKEKLINLNNSNKGIFINQRFITLFIFIQRSFFIKNYVIQRNSHYIMYNFIDSNPDNSHIKISCVTFNVDKA